MPMSGEFTSYPISGSEFGLNVKYSISFTKIEPTYYADVTVKIYLRYNGTINTPTFWGYDLLQGVNSDSFNVTGFTDTSATYKNKLLREVANRYQLDLYPGDNRTTAPKQVTISAGLMSVYYNGTGYSPSISGTIVIPPRIRDGITPLTLTTTNPTTDGVTLSVDMDPISSGYGTISTAYFWTYQIDGGTATWFTDYVSSLSHNSETITGLAQNTQHTAYVYAYAVVPGETLATLIGSNTATFTTRAATPPTITISITNVSNSTATLSATASESCNNWQYTINGTTRSFSVTSGSSVTQVITGLSARTSYTVTATATSADTGVSGTSSSQSFTTNGNTTFTTTAYSYSIGSSTLPISVNVANNTNKHSILLRDTSNSSSKLIGSDVTLSTGSNTLTLSSEIVSWIQNALGSDDSKTFTLVITTYDSRDNWIGTDETGRVTATVPQEAAPIFSDFSYYDVNSSSVALTGNSAYLVLGYSEIHVDASSARAQQGTIVSYNFGYNGITATSSSATFNVTGMETNGSYPMSVTVTDSYGRSTTVTKTVTTLAYSKISLSPLRLTGSGDSIEATVSGTLSSVMIGNVEKNSLVEFYYEARQTDTNTWTKIDDVTPTISGTTFSIADFNLDELDEDYSWYVRFVAKDKLSEDTSVATLTTSVPLMSFRKRDDTNGLPPRVGINNNHPNAALDVIGNIEMNGFNVLGFVDTIDSTVEDGLDSIHSSGIYLAEWISGSSMATSHYPTENTGVLEVLPELNGLVQRFTKVPTDGKVWVRHGSESGGSWSFNAWYQLSGGGAFTQEQTDWNQTVTTAVDYLKNKPFQTVDTQVIQGSTNPVQGGAIYTAIQNASSAAGFFKGTCPTAASVATKAVTCPSFIQADLVTGAMVFVTFSYTNSAAVADLKLDVNNTGAKGMKYMRNAAESNLPNVGYIRANMTYRFVYTGTYWVCDTDYDANSNTVPSAYCTTAATTAAKTATCTNYALRANTYVHVLVQYTNTKNTAITLNINSTGAKPIYINGTASSSENYNLPSGTYIAFYDGTAFQFRTDGKMPGSIMNADYALAASYASTAGTATSADTADYADTAPWTGIQNRPTLSHAHAELISGTSYSLVIDSV